MIDAQSKLPDDLAMRAERRTWFSRKDAGRVLDWIEDGGHRFLGMDVAEKVADGNWMLLIEPILDLSSQTDNREAVRIGRDFLADHDDTGRMFEPVWQGRAL